MERPDVRGHYEELATEYDEHWVYGPGYVPWMSSRICEALSLRSTDRIADIGCGTGLFAREVVQTVSPKRPLLCIDPSEAMLQQVTAQDSDTNTHLLTIRASAEEVADGQAQLPYEQLDAVWLKESVHHVSDQASALKGLAERLAPGGRLLVVMLPSTIEYPLFRAALDRFEALQPAPSHIVDHLRAAGLQADLRHVEHTLRIDRERYLSMVRARYMSVLSTFSDEEIEKGINEIRETHPESELVFPDRFAFVLGIRPDA